MDCWLFVKVAENEACSIYQESVIISHHDKYILYTDQVFLRGCCSTFNLSKTNALFEVFCFQAVRVLKSSRSLTITVLTGAVSTLFTILCLIQISSNL